MPDSKKVEYLAKRLDKLPSADGKTLHKMVQFHHDSPGLRKVRRDIAAAIIAVLDRYEEEAE